MWIERLLEPVLAERARTRPVVVLTGARQTGKTALVRRVFPEHAYVSLDLPSEAEQAERDPTGFLERLLPDPAEGRKASRPRGDRTMVSEVDGDDLVGQDRRHCRLEPRTGLPKRR
jgi:uncharacterized protein